MLWGVRKIGRRIQRERALEVLRANGTVYDVVFEDEVDKFDARLASSMIWSKDWRSEPTLFSRINEFLAKEDEYPYHIGVPQSLLPLVPNLQDLFSPDELFVFADSPSPAATP
jgi:hypothetical protein